LIVYLYNLLQVTFVHREILIAVRSLITIGVLNTSSNE
jgi:hypothetical protein